ncbi:NADH dehydrogenase [ubiquinone] 1 alpha subcomplex subunit 11-like [Ostrinia furnacalis]|uniref:NADH dehydrogenase [ubiquinone] 1 alpha subcomplex subunit 11-like n=1 Tax=Ostrinia furnacalis TaxID=93504 RepID=UPI00103B8DC2|nr:NADH dehydrogenase [ubiquinone] 1 alpha subcomplex subunit 11-like [Ostrinia furnacalis]
MSSACECPPTRNYYRYYDTPDGCDVMKKAMVTTRYGVVAGVILSTYDVMIYSQPLGLVNVLKRYMVHTVPLGLMGATFAFVANGVQNLRQKDDILNYFIGGYACSPFLAWYVGSKHALFVGGILMGTAAMVKKLGVDRGWTFIPQIPGHMNTVRSWRNDWSLAVDPRDDMMHTCGQTKK